MQKNPLVSVVVPAYNRAGTLGCCLRSIQTQTYQNWEAIVVDDGSTDDTPAAIEQLAREDARIRLIRHERNLGAQAARNTGIWAAQGEWIAFLDSDDQFLPHSLGARLELAMEDGVSVVHSDCNLIEADGTTRPYKVRPLTGWVYDKLLGAEGPVFPGLLVRKDALEKINGLDERIVAFQEWDTAIRLAKFCPFSFEPEPTFTWDCGNPDTISKDMRRSGKGYEQVFHKHFLAILRHLGPRALAEHYRLAAAWYRRAGDKQAVRRCLVMALVWSYVDPRTALQTVRHLLSFNR